jgi:signal transduction histidine kinase/ActR/RegA family two-component response regulator
MWTAACSTVCRMPFTVETRNPKILAMKELLYTSANDSAFVFPREHLQSAILVSLLSVWVLVGVFSYLNRYTRRPYFNIWTAAWLFYALWLTLSLNLHNDLETGLTLMFGQWCISAAAVFLLWGSASFLNIPTQQRLFGLFLGFLLVWSYVGAYHRTNPWQIQLPIFGLLGLTSILTAVSYYRLRRRNPRLLGAGLLAFGFVCWGLYMAAHPFFKASNQLVGSGFFISAVLQLFIAVSMIVLVLEESRTAHERMLLQLQQAEKLSALGRMISGVAHELNNPLAAIKGYLELLLGRPELNESIRPQLEKVAREGDRAAKLVGQFLSFARKQPPRQMPIQLNTLIRQLAESEQLKPSIPLILQLDLDPHLPLISGDPDQIHQVLANLVTNAIQAMAQQPHPRLLLKSERLGSHVRVMVEDNGPGIAADIVPHIFEPFFTTKEVGSGTGLGLSIAHSIIADHQGQLFFEPVLDGGARFVITLPMQEPVEPTRKREAPPTKTPTPAPSGFHPARILVLDDEPDIAEVLGEMLTKLGHQPTVCIDALEALALIDRQKFDLVLSDFRMPNLDGQQFYKKVVQKKPELARRVIFLTGDVMGAETMAFFKSAPCPHVAKPFVLANIEEAVARILSQPSDSGPD